MDYIRSITDEMTTFIKDVSTAYTSMPVMPRVLIGGAVGYVVFQTVRSYAPEAKTIMFLVGKFKKTPIHFKDGVIYVHIFPRTMGKYLPSPSPFVLKLETWLRLHKVKHEIVETQVFSKSTSKMPYIIYNGKEYDDSELIIDFLQKEFNIKDDITPAEMGIQRAFISMLDEKFFWIHFLFRFVFSDGQFVRFVLYPGLPQCLMKRFLPRTMPKLLLQTTAAQGIGRKPRDVINSIGNDDLKALSLYLGDKTFLAGDKITRADCCAFGHLAQIFYVDLPYPFTEFMRRECPNLEPYINRIKNQLWPDWNSVVDNSDF